MGSSRVLIIFPSCARDPTSARLPTGEKTKTTNVETRFGFSATLGCRGMLAPNAPTGSYNAGFSNKHVGSYRLIQAWSKMHLLRHKTTNPTPTEAVVKFSSKSWAREVTQSQTKKDICPIVTLPAHLQHQGGRVPTKRTYKGTRYFHSQEHQLRYGTEVTTWEIPSGNTQGICRESITV